MTDNIKEYQESGDVIYTGRQTVDYQEESSTTDIEESGI
jgi:hypothetical protein